MSRSILPLAGVVGRYFVAIALFAYGAQFLIYSRVTDRMTPAWPSGLQNLVPLKMLVGVVLVAAAWLIVSGKKARLVSLGIGVGILLWALGCNLPPVLLRLNDAGARNNFAESCGIASALFLLAEALGRSEPARKGQTASKREPIYAGWIGRFLLVVGLLIFGIEHLVYAEYVAVLVPGWIPGHFFWACFCGVALIAGAVGIGLNLLASSAALWTGVMILLFGILVNAPRAFTAWTNQDEWTSLFHTFAWSGAAFLLAATCGAKPAEGAAESSRAAPAKPL